MDFIKAPDIQSDIKRIVLGLGFNHVKTEKVVCFKSYGSKSRAIARIWSLPRIWQIALDQEAYYCLEVIAEKYDRLSSSDQERVLIHELLHIPKNFSGTLLSHNHNGRRINKRVVDNLFSTLYKERK